MRDAIRRRTGPPTAALLLLLAGCTSLRPPPPHIEDPPAAISAAEPAPTTTPPPVSAPRPRAEIALVLDASTPFNEVVANEIEESLPPRQYRVTRYASTEGAALSTLRSREVTVVAVGSDAVRAARTALPDKPLVLCQAPSYSNALSGAAWAVETLPPLKLQLENWRAVDPTLRKVALIVSSSGAALAEEARSAAAALATDLIVETSGSDRETLYLFRRLSGDVDGLWLLPDGVALSPPVLRELLSHAAARGIGVLTFNEALLSRGALLTATAVPSDIAATVARLVGLAVMGRTADLPSVTPLSAAAITVNPSATTALGLPPVTAKRWIARDAD